MRSFVFILLSCFLCVMSSGQESTRISPSPSGDILSDDAPDYIRYISDNDLIGLLLHEDEILASSDEFGRWIVKAYLGFLRNDAESLLHYAELLLSKYQDRLGGALPFALRLKAEAEMRLCRFASAAGLFRLCANYSPDVCYMYEEALALSDYGESAVSIRKGKTKIKSKPVEAGVYPVQLQTDGIETMAFLRFDLPYSSVSRTEAEALGMHIMTVEGEIGNVKVLAVADKLSIGKMTVTDVLFEVHETQQPLMIGVSMLSKIPYVMLTGSSVTFSITPLDLKKYSEAGSLLFYDNVLCVARPADGGIGEVCSLGEAVKHARLVSPEQLFGGRDVVVDTVNMILHVRDD